MWQAPVSPEEVTMSEDKSTKAEAAVEEKKGAGTPKKGQDTPAPAEKKDKPSLKQIVKDKLDKETTTIHLHNREQHGAEYDQACPGGHWVVAVHHMIKPHSMANTNASASTAARIASEVMPMSPSCA
jgi:hypothetical protein